MEREDSGVIDLFAIQRRASEAPPVPEPLMSSPPPAFTTDLLGPPVSHPDLDDLDEDNPFAKRASSKKPIYFAMAGAGALLVIGILVAAFSGSDPAPAATASAAHAPTSQATQAAALAPAPPPIMTAEPAPVAAKDVPAPPTTAASSSAKAPPRKARAKAKKKSVSHGVKLQKVQSTGI